MFGSRWVAQYGETDDGTWLAGLRDLTWEHLQRGMGRCARDRRDAWPPTLPEFRGLCLPSATELGLPEVDQAYRMAIARDWRHPIVWFAHDRVGSWAMRNKPETATRPIFERAYEDLLSQAQRGRVFEIPAAAGPALSHDPVPQVSGTVTPEAAIAEMRRRFGRGGKA